MLLLMLGGALGTGLRYVVGRWLGQTSWGGIFPLGTLFVNVTGSFILGAVTAVLLERMPEHQNWLLFLGTGFCGGYTTFSTFELETYRLVQNRSWWLVLANVFGSVAAGFLAVVAAVALVGLVFPKR
jgi:CrcB protein